MSGKGLTPGHAEYFEREVANGREDYYAGRGESPGQWQGRGAASAGLEGELAKGQLEALFAQVHPETGEQLGAGYNVSGTYVDRWGVEQPRHKQAAFDATFSVPKSVSELFAQLDPERQQLVVDAARVGNQAALDHLDRHAAFSRVGRGGVRQVDTDGLVVASYMHRTSRAGDPQLHFHNLIANRVRCSEDGVWRALDGRPIRAEQKAAGMIGQAAMRASLETSLGVEFGPVSEHGQAEILGVPQGLIDFHSKRGRQVKTHGAELIAACEEKLQRSLTPTERAVKYREAALQTRTAKTKDLDEIEGLADRWRQEAVEVGHDPAHWLGDVLDRPRTLEQARTMPDEEIVDLALEALMDTRSTWGRTHATREIARLVPHQLTTGEAVATRIEELTDRLMGHEYVLGITLDAPVPPGADASLVRADGTSQYSRHNAGRFTTYYTLECEQEILDHAEQNRAAGYAVPHAGSVDDAIHDRHVDGKPLSPDQEAAVRSVTLSGDAVSVVVGPAGAGKSATLRTVADAYDDSHIPVRGLAPSAKAAAVLRTEAGIDNSDTLAKLLYEQNRDGGPREQYQLQPGEVIVLDEASMAATDDLHTLVELAKNADAKLVLVGDYRQLGAVDAGGMFRLLANDTSATNPAELEKVWRFTQPWEANASLQLRDGHLAAIDTYHQHDRIIGGGRTELLEHAFRNWSATREYGASVIVTAPDSATVAEFNTMARQHLHATGRLATHSQNYGGVDISVGDEILTLRNDRQIIATDNAAVRNGDRWAVTQHLDNGGLAVTRLDQNNQPGPVAVLPAEYLDKGLIDHAYATTVHKAQGVTVDQSFTIVDNRTTAESLYVGATRGRHLNQMLAVTDIELGEFDIDGPPITAADVLEQAMRNTGAEKSATELMRENLESDMAERMASVPPVEAAAADRTIEPPPTTTAEREHAEQQVVGRVSTPPAEAEVVSPERIVAAGQELTGEQIRGLLVERVRLEQQRLPVNMAIDSIDGARKQETQHLTGLKDDIRRIEKFQIGRMQNQIEQISTRTLPQQLTTGPKRRINDRLEIDRLTQEIRRQEAIVRGLRNQIVRARNNTLDTDIAGGRNTQHRDLTRQRNAINNRIGVIDHTLDTDIDNRINRIGHDRTVDADIVDRYRLGAPSPDTPQRDVDRWIKGVARAEQHHEAWEGRDVDLDTVEWAARSHQRDGVNHARRHGLNALERAIPTIQRPGPDLGISR